MERHSARMNDGSSERATERRAADEKRRPASGLSPLAAQVLQLQQGAGNRAVARHIAGPSGGHGLLQRYFTKAGGTRYTPEELFESATVQKEKPAVVDKVIELAASADDLGRATIAQIIAQAKAALAEDVEGVELDELIESALADVEPHAAYTVGGYARYLATTSPQAKNWADFVEAQTQRAHAALLALMPADQASPTGQRIMFGAWRLSDLRGKALVLAGELDAKQTPVASYVAPQTSPYGLSLNAPRMLAALVAEMWQVVIDERAAQGTPAPAGDEARALAAPVPLVPEWGPVTQLGAGTWVRAIYRMGTTYPGGGAAEAVTTGHEDIYAHRGLTWDDKSKYFVRGHLLNDHVGGPSRPYNLVPIGGHDSPDVGSHVNWIQLHAAEGAVKLLVQALQGQFAQLQHGVAVQPGWLKRVEYYVRADLPEARPETKTMRWAADEWLRATRHCDAQHPTVPAPVTEVLGFLTGLPHPNIADLTAALDAVVPPRPSFHRYTTAAEAARLMDLNARLWDLEDRAVPSRLVWFVDKTFYLTMGERTERTESSIPVPKARAMSHRYIQ